MKKLTIYIGMFLLMISIAMATDCLSSCTLTGNHYKCTGAFTTCNEFSSTDYSIYIYDATITYTGANGGYGIVGGDGTVIISSDNKVRIYNTVITSTGGSGGDGNTGSSIFNAGAGGAAGLDIDAPTVDLENISLISVAGVGGHGYANQWLSTPDDCDGTGVGRGGTGGIAETNINSSLLFTTNNFSVSLTSGTGGLGQADACVVDCDGCCDSSAEQTLAANAGDTNIVIDINDSNLVDFDITTVGGNGVIGDVDTATDTGTGSCEEDPAVVGGIGGTLDMDIVGTNLTISDMTVTTTSGTTAIVVCTALAYASGAGEEASEYCGAPGSHARDPDIYVNVDYLSITGLVTDITGGNGGAAEAKYNEDSSSGCSYVNYAGGYGGDPAITLYSTNQGTVTNSFIDLQGGSGAVSDGASIFCSSDDSGVSGRGGNTYLYSDNITYSNATFDQNGGTGAVYRNDGKGGNAGYNYLYAYGTNS